MFSAIGQILFKILCGVGSLWLGTRIAGGELLGWLGIGILSVTGAEILGLATGIIKLDNGEGRVG